MERFNRFACWLLLLSFCLPIPCRADQQQDAADLSRVFDRLQRVAADIQSLSSDFVQEKRLAVFAENLLSTGRFFYRHPDHLRWELLTPVVSGFVLRGQQGERWNSLSKETGAFRIDTDPIMGIVAQQLLAWARVDIAWLKSHYRIQLLTEQPVRLKLVPRDPGEAGFIEQLQILFAADSRHVELVEMHEVGGDMTLLHFENTLVNSPLPAEAFFAPEFR